MLLRGGEWSRGDFLALLAIVVAIVGVVVAVLTIPGMPKLFHWDSDPSASHGDVPATIRPKVEVHNRRSVHKVRNASSGQVNFGCDQTISVETPVVYFGESPSNIDSRILWVNTDNAKAQNQSVVNVEPSAGHLGGGMKGSGTISGLDSQNILGVKNCPGGGHGELTIHLSWTENE
jgi:hypothetical protein